jgi:hypothetical protein
MRRPKVETPPIVNYSVSLTLYGLLHSPKRRPKVDVSAKSCLKWGDRNTLFRLVFRSPDPRMTRNCVFRSLFRAPFRNPASPYATPSGKYVTETLLFRPYIGPKAEVVLVTGFTNKKEA